MEAPQSRRRRVKIPAGLTKQLRDLDPEKRQRRVVAYMEEHGQDVEPLDGWTPYGPRIGKRDGR